MAIILLQKMASIIISMAMFLTGTIVPDVAQLKSDVTQLQMDRIVTGQANTCSEDVFTAGSTNFVAGGRYQLAGSGISSSATSIVLKSLTVPISGYEINIGDFGSIGYATVEPGSSSKKEFVSFTGITQDGSSAEATLTGVIRGLAFVSPYTASTTFQLSHSGGSTLIFSNPPQVYNRLAVKDNDETITGTYTFNELMTLDTYEAPTTNAQFAPKKYVDDVTNQGASTSSETVAGIVEIATRAEIASTTKRTGTTAKLVLTTEYATTSMTNANYWIPMTDSDGKLDQSFYDLTEAYTWTGKHIFANASTTANLDVGALSTFTGTSTFTVLPTLQALDPYKDNQPARKKYVDDNEIGVGVYGNGADGDTIISSNTNLARDMFYDDLTINNGITLSTKGYRIFIKGILTNNGTISNTGLSAVGSLGGGGAGGTAGTGAGGAGTSLDPALGANGGAGGAGNIGAGGAAGTITAPGATEGGFNALPAAITFMEFTTSPAIAKIQGGAGGGGGGGGDSGGPAGAGGGGAGVIMIIAKTLTNNGIITVAGGVGGNSSGGTYGSGGGGGGGVIVLIYKTITTGTLTVTGGAGGTGGENPGSAGSNGTTIQIVH